MRESPTVQFEGQPVQVRVGRRDVVQLPPRRFRARLKGLLFDTNRTFLLPGALNSIRRLKGYYDQHPGAEVLIVGHADTAGSDAYNLTLSRQRAEAVAAYLADRVGDWLAWYESSETSKRWGPAEDQHMLSALGDEQGTFHEGPVDGVAEHTRAGTERFQTWSNETRGTALAVDGLCGPNTRRELITVYMQQDETTLPPDTVVAVHGCGEFHPEVATADGVDEAENRRVEVFLFEEPITPAPQDPCPAPGCPEHAEWVGRTTETVDLRDQPPVAPGRIFELELGDDVLLPDDAELIVHGLPSPLRMRAAEHHNAIGGLYTFPIHDPPPGALCRATLVATKATQVLFDKVDLSQYVADAVAAGSPPFLPVALPDEAFQSREEEVPEDLDHGEDAFVAPFEDLIEPERGEVEFPPEPDRGGVFDDPRRQN